MWRGDPLLLSLRKPEQPANFGGTIVQNYLLEIVQMELNKCLIIYLSFLNCDWLLIREVQWFYWTQKLLVPVEKFTVRMPKVRLELATPGLQTQCSSDWAIQLKSYCWEGVEFIQLVYCIIIYLSFLNCDWLLIREVQWFYWTQKLSALAENILRWAHEIQIVRNPKGTSYQVVGLNIEKCMKLH